MQYTMAETELLYPKNVGAKVAMDLTYNEYSTPMAIEKLKILGAVLELPAKQHRQFCPFTSKNWAKLAKLAVLFSW